MIPRTARRGFAAAGFAALAYSGGFGTAHAALFDDDEARRRIEATNQRVEQLRRQFDERIGALDTAIKNQGLVDLLNQVEALRADVAQLRGQLEVITHELAEAQKRQRDLYVDLDSRLRKLETAAPPAVPPSLPPAGVPATAPPPTANAGSTFGPSPPAPGPDAMRGTLPPADVTAEQRAYDSALDQFKAGSYANAIATFTSFVRTYPKSPLAPSAQYWIGNAYYAQRDFRAAVAAQRQLLATYPDSQKVPDAMLNIATSQFDLGDGAGSRRTLEALIAKYPQSEAAVKARQRLAIR